MYILILMESNYKIPQKTSIGHVHLKVSNLKHSLSFYCDLLGFELMQKFGEEAAFISAGGYHHHITLNVWHSKNQPPGPKNAPGFYHTAICYPTRKDLAQIYRHLQENNYPLTGAADHGVSESLYLNDPDKNGVELYRNRPHEKWPRSSNGSINMYTKQLNIEDLLKSDTL